MRVLISIPARDLIHTEFANCLVRAVQWTMMKLPVEVGVNWASTTILSRGRTYLVNKALEAGADYMLWLDSDMTFPHDTLGRLLARELDIVGVNAIMRGPPHSLTADRKDGERLETTKESTGLAEVSRLGFGVLLTRMEVFHGTPKPWFEIPYLPEKEDYRGEDFSFCHAARSAGFTLWVDQDLTKQVGHLGLMNFLPV